MTSYEPCYMCNKRAVTREHVPPRGFSPEGYRKDLITVPSCLEHNNEKSGDDEYLRLVFSSLISGNELARDHVWPKILRSIQRKPEKSFLFRNIRPGQIAGINTGVFDADINRFFRIMERIDRGLYFHIFRQYWFEDIKVFPPATAFYKLNDPTDNAARRILEQGFENQFGLLPKLGNNPEVFYFQFYGDHSSLLMKNVFFGGIITLSAFNIQGLRELPTRISPPKADKEAFCV